MENLLLFFSVTSLCNFSLLGTLSLIAFSGYIALKDISNNSQQPSDLAVLALLFCFVAMASLTLLFLLTGMLLGKDISPTTFSFAWIGCLIGGALFLIGGHQVTKKELENETLSYKSWTILFSSVGIGASSMALFLPD